MSHDPRGSSRSTPWREVFFENARERFVRCEHRFVAWTRTPAGRPVMAVLVWLGLVLACCAVANSTHNPVIYSRF